MADDRREDLLFRAWSALKGATYPVFSRIHETAEASEVTPGQMGFLHVLDGGEPLTPREIARRLEITPATVTGALNRLEDAGLIERVRDDADRRVVHVRVTERGRALRARWRDAFRRRLEEVYAPLSDRELRELIDVLGKVGPPIHGPPGGFGALIRKDAAHGKRTRPSRRR